MSTTPRPQQDLTALISAGTSLHPIIKHAWDVFGIFDASFNVLYVSPAAATRFGLQPAALVGSSGLAVLDPAEIPMFKACLDRVVATEAGHERIEHRFRHGNGDWIVVQSDIHNLLDDPEIGGIVVYSHDVTDRSLLQRELLDSRLDVLRLQLQPHFLFNALRTIHDLIEIDATRAGKVLVALSELLGMSLENTRATVLPLRTELRFLEAYLKIQQERFPSVLVALDIDESAHGWPVPSFLLQPIVENCFRHAFFGMSPPHQIWISAKIESTLLRIDVRDNGRGFPNGAPSATAGTGIAMRNLTERMRRLYGESGGVRVLAGAGGGAHVRVLIPSA